MWGSWFLAGSPHQGIALPGLGPAWEPGLWWLGWRGQRCPGQRGRRQTQATAALAAACSAERSRTAPRWDGCAESAAEPGSRRSGSAARRSSVPRRAASCSGADETESCRVPPAFCRGSASFPERLLSLWELPLALEGSCSPRYGCAEPPARAGLWAHGAAGFMWGFRAIYPAQRAVSKHLHQMWWAQRHLLHNWESVLGAGGCWKVV